jgi:hypothetical protein
MQKLRSFGCSFIYGSDMLGATRDTPSPQAWPQLLADKLGLVHESFSRPGSGNLQIAEQVLNNLDRDSFYVIGWTWIDRFDCYQDTPVWRGVPWTTIRPTDKSTATETYYRDLHSEYRDKLTSLMYVRSVIDMLVAERLNFVMTYIDDLMFDQRWHTSPAVLDLQRHCHPHMTQFAGLNFLDWSRQRGYAISDTLHPLYEAHACASEIIYQACEKQNTIDPMGC